MTWVKVCGLTDESDVTAAVAGGADAAGFVNVTGSPRYVPLDVVAELAKDLPIHSVLLTLDLHPTEVVAVLEGTGLSGIQPYGEQAAAAAVVAFDAGYLVLYPQKAVSGLSLTDSPGIPLLDTPAPGQLGGTGQVFDWSLVGSLSERFILAGGLGPDNVAAAIETVRPWGVDASSRLEESPGRKHHGMVADFINKAKST
ncbi:MAG: phosphoribosylanthranilate isomerase [bacterium]|nr:phosphoribosylanthranilate isomerase [bacterium]